MDRKRTEDDHGARVGSQPCLEGSAGENARLDQGTRALRRAAWPEEENCKGETLIVENITRLAAHVRTEMPKLIVGHQEVIDQLLLVLICGGPALPKVVPRLRKTPAVQNFWSI